MYNVEFDESLVTGNEMIDEQHKELIGKIQDLLRSCEKGSEKATAVKMLNYLATYTDYHFKEEEKLQEEIEYPGIKEHKEKHKEFVEAIDDLHEMLEEEEGPSDAFVAQVNKGVVDWLFGHIKTFDRSVAEYKNMRKNSEMI